MSWIHPGAGRTGAATASLVVAVVVGVIHPVAGAMEVQDGSVDEQEAEADTSGEVDAGEAELSAEQASTAEVETEPDPDDATEGAPEPEPSTESAPTSELEPVEEPESESVSESDTESAPETGSELEPEPESALEPEPDPEPELAPTPEADAADDIVSDSTPEVEETTESISEAVSQEPSSEPDSDPDPDPSSDDAPAEPSASSPSSASASGSSSSSESDAVEAPASRPTPIEPQPSSDQADADAADDAASVPMAAPAEGRWPKRTVEAAGETVRPLATNGLSGADLAALKGTATSYPYDSVDSDRGVRAPIVAGPGDRLADESVPAPQVAATAERGTVERIAEVLGGAVPAGELAGIPAAVAVPMWLMLTGLALLMVVVAGHLRWASLDSASAWWALSGADQAAPVARLHTAGAAPLGAGILRCASRGAASPPGEAMRSQIVADR